MNAIERGVARLRLLATALAAIVSVACQGSATETDGGSETHFLSTCKESCGGGFVCQCGVCTLACDDSSACAPLATQATCVPSSPRRAEARCDDATPIAAFCDVGCLTDADCGSLEERGVCDSGYCRSADVPPSAGEPAECVPEALAANDLMIIGDSVIQLSSFGAELERAATATGALASGGHFRNYASAQTSFLADNMFSLLGEYDAARADGAARIVVMDGGATDMLQYTCGDTPMLDCAAITAAANGAETLLARMAADGVEHVLYFFYADPPGNAALKAGLDALRGVIQNACGHSPVACHWLDLRPVFANHDDYFAADGIIFSDAGAETAAGVVWDRLRERCVVP